jgi:hypothetical protein
MARSPSPVTRSKIAAAVCAIVAAGVKVYGVRVDASGFTVLTDPVPAPETAGDNATAARERIEARLREEYGDD